MDESLMNKVWYIETRPANEQDDGNNAAVFGGGLCVDPSGLILTVASVVTIPSLNQADCIIRARSSTDTCLDSRTVTLIDKFPHFDLALLQVSKSEDEQDFDFLTLGDSATVDAGDSVYAFVHINRFLYSGVSGYSNYPFPQDALYPGISERTVLEPPVALGRHRRQSFNLTHHFRTVASVVGNNDVQFSHMHPRLPLVQVTGFGKDPGCAGCPLFKLRDGHLIGLFSLRKHDFHFIIPQTFLKRFVDHVREKHDC